jgi:hypothetical protein
MADHFGKVGRIVVHTYGSGRTHDTVVASQAEEDHLMVSRKATRQRCHELPTPCQTWHKYDRLTTPEPNDIDPSLPG